MLVHKCVNGQYSGNPQIKYKIHNCRPKGYLMLDLKHVKTNYGQRTFDCVGLLCGMSLHLIFELRKKWISSRRKLRQFYSMEQKLKARAWKYIQVKYDDIACEQWCKSTNNLCAISNVHISIIILPLLLCKIRLLLVSKHNAPKCKVVFIIANQMIIF